MLTFPEEIMLMLLEDEDGKILHVPELTLRCVLSGAVLMELALKNKIDTDLSQLVVIDSSPTGDEMLDPTLQMIVESDEVNNGKFWVEKCALNADEIKKMALDRLIEKKILEKVDDRFLWVFRTRRYPVVDGKAEQEVKLRILDLLFSDKLPNPRDIVIISLVEASGIFKHLLSESEHKRSLERIKQIRNMDLLGRAVTNSVRDIEASLALALHPPF
ncbi:MAG: GPP34 family phosphoprotein [Paracoccaceae bacterium]|nr:GPP34 family phosphoprotein [Paracoccaceae bacterium]MDE2738030.1 GPP34 family phosphoprotein [Paracoccaceae bacterium]MDE2760175.1 GPP34 family phosphoprotein [Paracoccaceae bacterium]MDE2917596.1 GPP34 family phosphoprotein [Paracoccaceae bacterium]MYE37291.1 GPP34 family phosphoprotein [Paracoccaceae bacterium]